MSTLSNFRANTLNKYSWLCDDVFARWIVGHLSPYGKSILDVGCGNGFMIPYYMEGFYKTDVLEPTKELYEKLLEEFQQESIGIYQEFAEKMSFADDSYDVVLAKSSLHHFQNPVRGIEEMKRVSRKAVAVIEVITPDEKCIPFAEKMLIKKERDREKSTIFTKNAFVDFVKKQLPDCKVYPLLYDQYIDVGDWLQYSDLSKEEQEGLYNLIKDADEIIKSNLHIHYRKNRLVMLRRMCMCVAVSTQPENCKKTVNSFDNLL